MRGLFCSCSYRKARAFRVANFDKGENAANSAAHPAFPHAQHKARFVLQNAAAAATKSRRGSDTTRLQLQTTSSVREAAENF